MEELGIDDWLWCATTVVIVIVTKIMTNIAWVLFKVDAHDRLPIVPQNKVHS